VKHARCACACGNDAAHLRLTQEEWRQGNRAPGAPSAFMVEFMDDEDMERMRLEGLEESSALSERGSDGDGDGHKQGEQAPAPAVNDEAASAGSAREVAGLDLKAMLGIGQQQVRCPILGSASGSLWLSLVLKRGGHAWWPCFCRG
jgi:hypothetical protein